MKKKFQSLNFLSVHLDFYSNFPILHPNSFFFESPFNIFSSILLEWVVSKLNFYETFAVHYHAVLSEFEKEEKGLSEIKLYKLRLRVFNQLITIDIFYCLSCRAIVNQFSQLKLEKRIVFFFLKEKSDHSLNFFW